MHPGEKIFRLDQAAENAYMNRNGQHIVLIKWRDNVLLKLEDVHLVRNHNPGGKTGEGFTQGKTVLRQKMRK